MQAQPAMCSARCFASMAEMLHMRPACTVSIESVLAACDDGVLY